MLGTFALLVKAHLPIDSCKRIGMKIPTSQILADNLRKLMKASKDLTSQADVGAKAGVNQRTVGRILNQEHFPTLDILEAIAGVFKLEPWQLLVPNLDPSNPPAAPLTRSEADAMTAIRTAAQRIQSPPNR